jgi:drug/metabolite transporter (DMT)-like permease
MACCKTWKSGVPPTWLVFAAAVAVQVGFGLYPVIVKYFAARNNANPLIFSFYRDVLCFPVLFVCALAAERKILIPRCRILVVLMVLGLFGMFGNQLFFILGVYLAGPDIASAFQPIIPVWTAILAALTCIEKIPHPVYVHGWAKFIGIILAAGGAVEITVTGQSEDNDSGSSSTNSGSTNGTSHVSHYLLGCMSLFLNTICMAIYVLVQKRFIFMAPNCRWKEYPVATTAYSYFFGAVFMGLASLYYPFQGRVDVYHIPRESLYALVFAIFITSALCYLLITWTNMHLSSSIATAFWPVQVFVTGIAAWLITHDTFKPLQYLGVVMLIVGLLLVLFSNYMSERQKEHRAVLRLDACTERKVAVGGNSSSESSEEDYKPLLSKPRAHHQERESPTVN